jgi:hypothetical protein
MRKTRRNEENVEEARGAKEPKDGFELVLTTNY